MKLVNIKIIEINKISISRTKFINSNIDNNLRKYMFFEKIKKKINFYEVEGYK